MFAVLLNLLVFSGDTLAAQETFAATPTEANLLCRHRSVDECAYLANSASPCLPKKDCLEWYRALNDRLSALPPVTQSNGGDLFLEGHSPSTEEEKNVIRARNVIYVSSDLGRVEAILSAPLLAVPGHDCSPSLYIAFSPTAAVDIETCSRSTDESCLCNVKVSEAAPFRENLFFRFHPSITSNDLITFGQSYDRTKRRLTSEAALPEASETQQPDDDVKVYSLGLFGVKALQAVFMIVAFVGNAAFMIFVFWLSHR